MFDFIHLAAVVMSTSNSDVETNSSPDTSPKEQAKPSKGGFGEILSAQQQLFSSTDRIIAALVQKEPDSDGNVQLEAQTIRSMQEIFGTMKDFFLLFQKKAIDEITTLEQALRESKDRELEWKELADLFTQYRTKVSGEMLSMKSVIESYGSMKAELQEQIKQKETQISMLQDELVLQQDILLRVLSIGKRRANLLAMERDIGEEEAAILKTIDQLRNASE